MNFSINKTFKDSSVNALLDNLYYQLEKHFPEVDTSKNFVLTGRAAAILQGSEANDLDNIVFITSDKDVFSFVQQKLNQYLKTKGAVLFKERVLFYFDGLHLEIWTTDDALNVVNKNQIFIQHIDDINPVLL
ncbi:MAG: hypothetical protein BM557_01395 [Flavobacterium sp. MedPE-SWcel]|mgnify:CR=1 FL=1|uniref:hypothetical protein n=1 Tax=uncultured Flavobacterium sp. TaxID=165435 RepID=UPI00091122AF|nr:hypothetical protein [uncultured Flavobacterium sp.]OIQ22061.1 MAG: hypothetical protein BM557_01395 [Flavobacterium sp. MedPE-SWcel]